MVNLIAGVESAREIPNPIAPAWFDVAFSLIPIVVLVSMIVGLVSIAKHRGLLRPIESFMWSVFVIMAPVLGTVVWFSTARRSLAEHAPTE